LGKGRGALTGRVTYLIPAVITIRSVVGEIATGEALGSVKVCSVKERIHTGMVVRSGSSW
jgi:hypothetical protein